MSKNEKTYSISQAQQGLLTFVQRHQQVIFASLLSDMAYRMGYKVTENTQFEISDDWKELKVIELSKNPPTLTDAVIKAK